MFLTSCASLTGLILAFTQVLALRSECPNWSLGHSLGIHGIQFLGVASIKRGF